MAYNKPVLFIDDNISFVKEFVTTCKPFNISIIHKTNFKDMVDALPILAGKICCVILDIKCLMHPDQQVENPNFLSQATSFLDRNYKQIPRVILTADKTEYNICLERSPQELLFLKTKEDIIKMLQYIDNLDSDKIRIRSKYPDVFNIMDNSSLPDSTEVQLIELVINSESTIQSDILNNLASIRRIQESIFQSINKKDKDIVPDSLFKENKDVKFWDIHKHLQGNPSKESNYKSTTKSYYSGIIVNFSEVLYKVSSDNGAHNPYEKPDYLPTKYTVISQLHALFDFIKWYGTLI